MLRLMDIQLLRHGESEDIYQVTVERDGVSKRYEFEWVPPSRPGWPEHVHEPRDVVADLLDYDEPPVPGQPCGALLIQPLRDIKQYVFKVADGKTLDFPIVLDER